MVLSWAKTRPGGGGACDDSPRVAGTVRLKLESVKSLPVGLFLEHSAPRPQAASERVGNLVIYDIKQRQI
jgi:hypothetical protein